MRKLKEHAAKVALMLPLYAALVLLSGASKAGELEPTGPPDATTMHSLNSIYHLILEKFETIQRFRDNGNGTVSDLKTGIMWAKHANLAGDIPQDEAVSYCADFELAGYDDWRLPEKKELEFFAGTCPNGGLAGYMGSLQSLFTNVMTGYYWTATPSDSEADFFWSVNMTNGCVDTEYKNGLFYVWPMRVEYKYY